MSEPTVERAAAPPKQPKGSQKKILGLPMPVALGLGAGVLALAYLYFRSKKKAASGTTSTTTSTALPQNIDSAQLAAELEQLLAEQTSNGVSGFTGGGTGSGPGQGGTSTGTGTQTTTKTGTSTKTTTQTGNNTGGGQNSSPATTSTTGQQTSNKPPVNTSNKPPVQTKPKVTKPATAPRGSYSQPSAFGATLHWIASPPGQQYHVQVWHDTIASGLVHDSTVNSNSLSVSGLKGGTHYGWRVAAVNAAGQGPYTTGNSFTTTGLSGPPAR